MSLERVARRYAVALADVACEKGETEAIHQELVQWYSLVKTNSQLRAVFGDPTIPYERKKNVLAELIARSRPLGTTANFLQLLLRNQRISALGEINQKFAEVLNERAGVIDAHVTVAREVSEEAKEALLEALTSLTGKRVRVTFAIDEELIGGVVAQIGSTVYDGSVRSQLREIEQALAGE